MKKYILTLLSVLALTISSEAQTIKNIPFSREIQSYGNGWHKFELRDAKFDVEIEAGVLLKGNITWLDGTTYSGNMSGTTIAGRGTYTWTDGSRYEGSFKNNKRHGKGSMIAPDGSKWSGKWKNNKKNGKGKMYDSKGDLVQQGVWENDQLVVK